VATEAPTSPESPAEIAAEGTLAAAESATSTPPERPADPDAPGSLKNQGLGVAIGAGVLAFLLMAHKGQLPFGVPIGMVLVTVCALGLLAALGTFDAAQNAEEKAEKLASPFGPLGLFVAGGVAFATALGLAGWGLGPGALWAVLVPGTFLAWVVSFFRLGVAIGPFANDPRGGLLRRHGFWVVALGGLLYLPAMGLQSLWDPWETHYGEVAREILAKDDWISLWWAQDGWFWSKPILNFWIQALAMGSLGTGYPSDMMLQGFHGGIAHPEWVVRAPNVLISIGALYVSYKAVAKVYGPRAGLLGALVLATMPQWYFITHQTMADMPLVAPLTACMGMLLLGLNTDPEKVGKSYHVEAFGRRIALHGFHLLFLFILVPSIAEILYLLSRNLEFLVGSKVGFRPHWDEFMSGSGGNCTVYGNEPCHTTLPASLPKGMSSNPVIGGFQHLFLGFEPLIQGLMWAGVLGFVLYLNRTERRLQRLFYLGAWFLAALATMGKGPLGFVLPAVCAFAYLGTKRRFVEITRLEIISGLALIGCVALPWYVAMYVRHGSAFTDRLIFHDMVNRTFRHVHDTNEGDDTSFRFYIWQLGYATFPWTGLVPLGLMRWMRRGDDAANGKGDTAVFLMMWFVFAFALFSFMGTKFHHYIFPAVPPLAMLTGIVLDELLGKKSEEGEAAAQPSVFARGALALAAAGSMVGGISAMLPGAFLGPTTTVPPAAASAGMRGLGGVLVAVGFVLLGALFFLGRGSQAPAAEEPNAAKRHDRLLTAAGTLAGLGALALVGRDVAMAPEGNEPMGALRFLCLYSYQYKRAWPESLDFTAALTAISIVAVVAAVALSLRWFRERAVLFVAAVGVVAALWGIDVYMVKASPHWGQREIIEAYYKDRKDPDEALIAYQMNWKGENFYTSNHIPAFVASGQKFKDWIRDEKAKGHSVLYFVTEHGRVGGLKSEVGGRNWRELTDKTVNNKFLVLRVEL
jgi:4-amino-4-deoxy-L-arabinose transferase-like glycosyltransferase